MALGEIGAGSGLAGQVAAMVDGGCGATPMWLLAKLQLSSCNAWNCALEENGIGRDRRPGATSAPGRRGTGWWRSRFAVAGGLLVDGGAVLAGVGLLVRLVAEVLQLYIEMVGAEDVAEAEERGAGVVVAAGVDEVAHLAVAAAGEADEPFGVGAQRLEGDQGRALALGIGQMGGGEEAAEVGVALAGLGEKHQVVRIVGGAGAGVGAGPGAAGRSAAAGLLAPPAAVGAGRRRPAPVVAARPAATPPAPRRRRSA